MQQASTSLPGSPAAFRRNSRTRQFSWRKKVDAAPVDADRHPYYQQLPLVTPCLDNLDLPYVDESTACTPTNSAAAAAAAASAVAGEPGDPAANEPTYVKVAQRLLFRGGGGPAGGGGGSVCRRHSTMSRIVGGSRKASRSISRTRAQSVRYSEYQRNRGAAGVGGGGGAGGGGVGGGVGGAGCNERRGEPTHFRWNASIRIKRSKVADPARIQKSFDSVRFASFCSS